MSARCLFLGSTGYVGGVVRSELIAQGMQVFPLIRSTKSTRFESEVFLADARGDFELEKLITFMRFHSIDSVVHAANLFDPSPSPQVAEEMLYANLLVPGKVLRAAIEVDARVFVNLASGWQLDAQKTTQSPDYVSTKQALRALLRHQSAKILGVSVFVNEIIGVGDTRKKLVNEAIDCGLGNRSMTVRAPDQIVGLANVEKVALEIATILKDPGCRPREYVYQNFSNFRVREVLDLVSSAVRGLRWSEASTGENSFVDVGLPMYGDAPREALRDLIQEMVDGQRAKKISRDGTDTSSTK